VTPGATDRQRRSAVTDERIRMVTSAPPPHRPSLDDRCLQATSRSGRRAGAALVSETVAVRLPSLAASDFYGYYRPSECGLRIWLREKGVEEAPPSPYSEVLMRLGREHEERHLARFPNAIDLSDGSLEGRAERTLQAITDGERVIYQGVFRTVAELEGREVELVGIPDFMLPARRGYAIRDSKLARRIGNGSHPEIELQLQAYGLLYERVVGEPPVALQIHNGIGAIVDVPYDGGSTALEVLEEILRLRLSEEEPTETVGWSKCSGCGFFERCWPAAVERHSVGLLPWVDRGLVAELESMGVRSYDELLERFDAERLAELERPWGKRRQAVGPQAERVLTSARALATGEPIVLKPPAIPEHPSYVMFDLEGLPPQLDELEKIYLWGLQVFGERPGPYRAATARFGPAGDHKGWELFLREAEGIFAEHGDIPFVHWASYERTKVDLYVGRYGDHDGIAARVRRNLLDLLPITYESMALPTSSYSLKQVEQITGFERRLTDAGGDWSMARYIEATETNDARLRASIMDEILDYNREDLEATWAVMEWLRSDPIGSGSGLGN
jgi:predicted RecB family nuclease